MCYPPQVPGTGEEKGSEGNRERGEGNSVEKRGLAALKKQRKKQYRIRLTRRRLNKGGAELKRRNI